MGEQPFRIVFGTQDLEPTLRALRDMGRKQIPFAAAAALTEIAGRVQKAERANLRRAFTLRRKNLGARIFRRPAEKRDWPKVRAAVGFGQFGRDEFWTLQETGGTKRAIKGSRIAIPYRIVRRTGKGTVRAPDKPKRIGAKGWEIEDKLRAKLGRRKAAPSFTYYGLRTSARIKPALGARKIAEKIAGRDSAPILRRSLRNAIRTARRGGGFTSGLAKVFYRDALKAPR